MMKIDAKKWLKFDLKLTFKNDAKNGCYKIDFF
jgi:hypothetical protein